MIKKLIVTNSAVLQRKYGATGWKNIQRALTQLALADGLRGITTSLELLNTPGGAGIPKVTTPGSGKQVKATLDALFKKYASPDYVLILGAPDVVPHQLLDNPAFGGDDDDKTVPSDLPYACDAPYSTDIGDFLGPTRVVGRIPDVKGDDTADELIALIDAAAKFTGTSGKDSFVLSAGVWKGATAANVKLAFGKSQTVALCPPKGPTWVKKDMSAPLHFINCHGALKDDKYYGQHGEDYPIAHQPSNLTGTVTPGAIVVAECCYGAELYNPDKSVPLGISTTYLLQGAMAFCGSTTIAYGESTAAKRCDADLLCTSFLSAILDKATTGRALLQARQEFVKGIGGSVMDAFDLKTLAQFLLLGDPSLRPFGSPAPHAKWLGLSPNLKSLVSGSMHRQGPTAKSVLPAAHRARRRRLKAEGDTLARTVPHAFRAQGEVPEPVQEAIVKMMEKEGLTPGTSMRFDVDVPSGSPRSKNKAKGKASLRAKGNGAEATGEAIHVVFAKPSYGEAPRSKSPAPSVLGEGVAVMERVAQQVTDLVKGRPNVPDIRAVVARTRNGKVISLKSVWSK